MGTGKMHSRIAAVAFLTAVFWAGGAVYAGSQGSTHAERMAAADRTAGVMEPAAGAAGGRDSDQGRRNDQRYPTDHRSRVDYNERLLRERDGFRFSGSLILPSWSLWFGDDDWRLNFHPPYRYVRSYSSYYAYGFPPYAGSYYLRDGYGGTQIYVGPLHGPAYGYYPDVPSYDMLLGQGQQGLNALPQRPPAGTAEKEDLFPSSLAPMLGGPQEVSMDYVLGEAMMRVGDYGEAAKLFAAALARAPEQPDAKIALALALTGAGEYVRAAQELREGMRGLSDWETLDVNFARVYEDADAYQAVLGKLQKGLAARPEDEDLRLLLAFHYYASGKLTEAQDEIRAGVVAGARDPLMTGLLLETQHRLRAVPQADAHPTEPDK